MTGLQKKLILILIPVLVLLIALGGVLIFLPDNKSDSQVYVEQIKQARQLAESGDYQGAISHYKAAIEKDETNEEPYLELARLYLNLGNREEAIQTLRDGYVKTRSLTILGELESQGESVDGAVQGTTAAKQQTAETVEINSTMGDMFSTFNYRKYSDEFTVKSENASAGTYTVTYAQYDVEFEYQNTPDRTIIDPATRYPYGYARPTSIRVRKLSQFITGADVGVTADQLRACGAENLTIGAKDEAAGYCLMTFIYKNMNVTVACDESGTVKGDDSYNSITPQPGNADIQKVKVSGEVIDVTTGAKVSNVNIKFRSGKNVQNGSVVEENNTSGGNYSVELEPGDYTAELNSPDYNTEFVNVFVPEGDAETQVNFSISPKLQSNEIRFVLEWGATPADLDSHLSGTYDGSTFEVDWTHTSYSKGGEVICDLDIDDQSGFGPETITLHKTNGSYTYKIHRYSSSGDLATSGATVKIYNGNASPIVLTVPDNVDSEWWTVCDIENGQIKNLNGKQR